MLRSRCNIVKSYVKMHFREGEILLFFDCIIPISDV